jgi:hypothetical protein
VFALGPVHAPYMMRQSGRTRVRNLLKRWPSFPGLPRLPLSYSAANTTQPSYASQSSNWPVPYRPATCRIGRRSAPGLRICRQFWR